MATPFFCDFSCVFMCGAFSLWFHVSSCVVRCFYDFHVCVFICIWILCGGEYLDTVDNLLMEEILHHLGCIGPCDQWNKQLYFILSSGARFLPSTIARIDSWELCFDSTRGGAWSGPEWVESFVWPHSSFCPEKSNVITFLRWHHVDTQKM